MKLALCVPWDSPFVFLKFARSALNLAHPAETEVQWFFGEGWCPARRHTDACERALAWGADLLCILGADQEYPGDMLPRLLEHWVVKRGIIAAMVPFRGYVSWNPMQPFQPLAWRAAATEDENQHLQLLTREGGALQRATIIGTGVVLFHSDLLRQLPRPWFAEAFDPLTMHRTADQDSRFIRRLGEENGVSLWVDTTIKVLHDHVMSIDDTYQQRFADWADPATPGIDRSICRFLAELPTIGGA